LLQYDAVTAVNIGPRARWIDDGKNIQVTLVTISSPIEVASDTNDPPRAVASVKTDLAVQPSWVTRWKMTWKIGRTSKGNLICNRGDIVRDRINDK